MDNIQKLIGLITGGVKGKPALDLANEVKLELESLLKADKDWRAAATRVMEVERMLREKSAAVDRMASEVLSLTESTQASLAKATELANQRDQVQRKLDSTLDQMNQAIQVGDDLRGLLNERGRRMNRMAGALTAAEKDLADLRWLVRGAREGADRPPYTRILVTDACENSIGKHNSSASFAASREKQTVSREGATDAKAEGGVK